MRRRDVRRRGRYHHEDEQRIGAVVDEAVLDPGGGDKGLAGGHALVLPREREAPRALEDVVDLVLVTVGVGLLRLTRRHAVEIELRPLRGGEPDLGHPGGVELDVVFNSDFHGLIFMAPSGRAPPDRPGGRPRGRHPSRVRAGRSA